MYTAIVEYFEKESCVKFVMINDDFNLASSVGIKSISEFGAFVVSSGLTPINFEVDRVGSIKDSCGSFSRLKRKNQNQRIGVVIAEIKTDGGRSLGYRILDTASLVIANIRTNEVVAISDSQNEPYLHNGIVRNKAVACYPLHKFNVITVEMQKPKRNHKDIAPSRPEKQRKVSNPSVKKEKEVQEFTEAQLNEIKRCRQSLGNSTFIENSNLSDKQMRVLWVAKKQGAFSESFANPDLSVEAMKFYADRLVNKKVVSDCLGMLSKPSIGLPELAELYLCVCDGIPYNDLLDKTASEIQCEREMRRSSFWTSMNASSGESDSTVDKTIDYALKLRGY